MTAKPDPLIHPITRLSICGLLAAGADWVEFAALESDVPLRWVHGPAQTQPDIMPGRRKDLGIKACVYRVFSLHQEKVSTIIS